MAEEAAGTGAAPAARSADVVASRKLHCFFLPTVSTGMVAKNSHQRKNLDVILELRTARKFKVSSLALSLIAGLSVPCHFSQISFIICCFLSLASNTIFRAL